MPSTILHRFGVHIISSIPIAIRRQPTNWAVNVIKKYLQIEAKLPLPMPKSADKPVSQKSNCPARVIT